MLGVFDNRSMAFAVYDLATARLLYYKVLPYLSREPGDVRGGGLSRVVAMRMDGSDFLNGVFFVDANGSLMEYSLRNGNVL